MKGLLLKDFYTLWKNGRIFFVVFVVISAISGAGSWSYMGFWLVLMGMQTVNTFSYDNYCNWNLFALTMPITRKDVVRSKFLLQLFLTFGSALAFLLVSLVSSLVLRTFHAENLLEMALTAWNIAWVILLMGNVSNPLLFRFPPERARLISMLVYLLPMCAGIGAGSVMTDELPVASAPQLMGFLYRAAVATPILSLIVSGLCYYFSCRIFQKKDLT